jgi:hypothetical protein
MRILFVIFKSTRGNPRVRMRKRPVTPCVPARVDRHYFVLISDEALCISGVLATVQLYFIAEERLEIPMRRLSKLHCLQRLSKYSMCAHSDTHSKSKYPACFPVQGVFRDPGMDVTMSE